VIKRGAFYPQPNVDSAVVTLVPLSEPVSEETPVFRDLVKAAFLQRRKTLRNAWSGVVPKHRKKALEDAASRVGIDLSQRGEVLSVVQFASMARELERLNETTD
jgi:16S rRNA (adenine1518-N6/adenine1519-N6)-dimethyltransferase